MWKKILQWFGFYKEPKVLDEEEINKIFKEFTDKWTEEDKAAGTWPYAAPSREVKFPQAPTERKASSPSRVNSSGSSFNPSAPSPAPVANRYDSPPTDNFTSGLVVGYMASSISSNSSSRYDSDSCSSSSSYSDSSSSCDSGSSSSDW